MSKKVIHSTHALIKYKNEYYCVYNKKYKKYAPIGGKMDVTDVSPISGLMREVLEEVEMGHPTELKYIAMFTYTKPNDDTHEPRNVALYTIETPILKKTKESFLRLVKLNGELINKLNPKNSYGALIRLVNKLDLR